MVIGGGVCVCMGDCKGIGPGGRMSFFDRGCMGAVQGYIGLWVWKSHSSDSDWRARV